MADVDDHTAGLAAREAGADIVATTLSGYTGDGPVPSGPDLDLVAKLVAELDCPVIAEGRYSTPEEEAGLVCSLASDVAASITAQAINVCGGLENF